MARRRDITRDDILDAAQRLMQQRGANGFSVRDLSGEIGFSAASLHHHFPSRADLLAAVLRRYRERFNARMAEIEAETENFFARLERLIAHFASVAGAENRVCPAAVSAVEFNTLPEAARDESLALWANLSGWIFRFSQQAKVDGDLPGRTAPDLAARHFTATLQGALLLQRMTHPGTLLEVLHEAVESLRR